MLRRGEWRFFAFVGILPIALGAPSCSAPDEPRFGSPNPPITPPVPRMASNAKPCNAGADDFIPNEPACAVSWSKDIFPLMKSSGQWRCAAAGCHGAGGVEPTISDDADVTWESLRQYPLSPPGKGGAYVNPCSRDPEASGLVANLEGRLGSQMPKPPGVPASVDQVRALVVWERCGAPRN